MSGSDRSLLNAFREIQAMASRVNLPKTITVSIAEHSNKNIQYYI